VCEDVLSSWKKMIHMLFFVLCLLSSHVSLNVDGIQTILKEDLDLDRQLELINKPPMKSIHACLKFVMLHHICFLELISHYMV